MVRVVVVFVRAVFNAVDAALDDVFGFLRGMIHRRARFLTRTARIAVVAMTGRHEQSCADEANHQRIAKLMTEAVVVDFRQ